MMKSVIKIHLPKASSTHTWVRENYTHFDLNKIVRVTASQQTHGRGQFNRIWVSPKEGNIYVTYFTAFEKFSLHLSHLAQIFCLSITELLLHQTLSPQIKWPNDILVNRKKIAGVLCEIIDLGKKYGVVISAGINVNMSKKRLDSIDQPATSLRSETGKTYLLKPLLSHLDQFFFGALPLYQAKGFKPFYETYNSLLACKGNPITLHHNEERSHGVLHSISSDGRLNLLLDNGEVKTVSSGRITFRS